MPVIILEKESFHSVGFRRVRQVVDSSNHEELACYGRSVHIYNASGAEDAPRSIETPHSCSSTSSMTAEGFSVNGFSRTAREKLYGWFSFSR